MNLEDFEIDLSETQTQQFLPEGSYAVIIGNAGISQSGDNAKLFVEFQSIEDATAGFIASDTFWLQHSNPKAVETGSSRLSWLLRTIGFEGKFKNFKQAIGKTLKVTVQADQVGEKTYHKVVKFEKYQSEQIDDLPF